MPKCDFCEDNIRNKVMPYSSWSKGFFYPSDMISEPIEHGDNKGKRMCHFCAHKSDIIVDANEMVFKREDVLNDYHEFCNKIYHNPDFFVKANKKLITGS